MTHKTEPTVLDKLMLDLGNHRPTITLACFTVTGALGAQALAPYKFEQACHGGWGPCSEVHHLERTSSTSIGGQRDMLAHWDFRA